MNGFWRKQLSKTPILASLLFTLTLASCARSDQITAPSDWNVVVVTLDTTRADRIGAFGGTSVPTPHLDQAAKDGMRFTTAIAPVPLTLPSHTSMFTGQYPFRHGVRHNGAFKVPPSAITLAERLQHAGFRTGAFVGAFVLDGTFGLDQGFDTYSGVGRAGASADFLHPAELQRTAQDVNAAALPWIESTSGKRFFAWIHYYDPHHPYAPPEGSSLRLEGTGYDREISYVDHCFGELVRKLSDDGILDRTLLVVAGDHGESLGSHGERNHGVFLYEPALHVPFFVRAPGLVAAGGVYHSPVSLVDLAPTVLSLLGLPPLEHSDGRALLAPSGAMGEDPQRVLYAETQMPRIELGWSDLSMVRDSRYKYVRAPRPELYDLSSDPQEANNLADREPDETADLAELLDGILASGGGDAPAQAANVLSKEELAKLQSLGYLRGGGGARGGALPDPKDRIAEAAHLSDADECLERGELDRATALFKDLVQANPGNHTALQGLARALLRKGELARAEEAALAALAAAGSDPQAPQSLTDNARALVATILSLEGRSDEAARALRPTAAPGSRASAPPTPASTLMAAAKNLQDAQAIVGLALDRHPSDPWSWEAALELARRIGDPAGVERSRRRMLALGPSAAPALVDAGTRAQDAGDRRLAASLFETALQVHPDHPDILGYLGTARIALHDLDGAEQAFLAAGRVRPEDPRVPMYLADIALLRGDERKAKALIDQALERSPQFVPPLLNYARWLEQKGRNAEAIEVVQSALSRRPGDPNAAALLNELRTPRRAG